MRKIISFIIFLIVIFITNLVFYTLSDDYKFFLKKIKWKEEVVYLEDKKYDDSLEYMDSIDNEKSNEYTYLEDKKEENKKEEEEEYYELIVKEDKKEEVTLWKTYTDILDLFSIYELKKLEVNSHLFDLTDEYPDKYYEYYSKWLTLYFFNTKRYDELQDIFWVISDELPFTLKEVNNFWDKSFYINLDDDIKDRFIRLVISSNWVTFWLKIKNNEYGLVKDRLNYLRDIIEEPELSWSGELLLPDEEVE